MSDRLVAGISGEHAMQYDSDTISAVEAAIVGRFAARASKAADVVTTTDDSNYFVLFVL